LRRVSIQKINTFKFYLSAKPKGGKSKQSINEIVENINSYVDVSNPASFALSNRNGRTIEV
jgi:hypothetical protein